MLPSESPEERPRPSSLWSSALTSEPEVWGCAALSRCLSSLGFSELLGLVPGVSVFLENQFLPSGSLFFLFPKPVTRRRLVGCRLTADGGSALAFSSRFGVRRFLLTFLLAECT